MGGWNLFGKTKAKRLNIIKSNRDLLAIKKRYDMKSETLKVIIYNSSTIEQKAKLFGHNKFWASDNFGSDSGIMYRAYFNNRNIPHIERHIPYIESILTTAYEPCIIKNMKVVSNFAWLPIIPNHKHFVLTVTYFRRLLQSPPVSHKILGVVQINKSQKEVLDGNTHFELSLPPKKSVVFVFEIEKIDVMKKPQMLNR